MECVRISIEVTTILPKYLEWNKTMQLKSYDLLAYFYTLDKCLPS